MQLLSKFDLQSEKEDFELLNKTIQNAIDFKGTNLWILIFAIFIASLGLNINSTAVIIGAMLVSPLMGPIIGMGFSIAISDLNTLRKSAKSYLLSTSIALLTSTLFFYLSPLNEAHSEILARTSPTIYDVLIALFGGFAGIIAISTKNKGNVLPGVAIATALMPPLCTAGYGLAILNFTYFIGAIYLFLINTVFIAFASILTIRYLHYPKIILVDKTQELKARRIIGLIVIVTILPSIYFGYDVVTENRFNKKALLFIENEANFKNDYIIKKTIDAKNNTITLNFGGQLITKNQIENLKSKLRQYNLDGVNLNITQGFSYVLEEKKEINNITDILKSKELLIDSLSSELDQKNATNSLRTKILTELKINYPDILGLYILSEIIQSVQQKTQVENILITCSKKFTKLEKLKMKEWLKVRLENERLNIFYEVIPQ